MLTFRYSLIAALCIALAISSCQCQCGKSGPPLVEEAPQTSGFDVPKPKVADSLRVTPAERPEPEPLDVAEEPPPLPEDFPEDIPLLEDSEVAQVQALANDAHNVIFVTAKPVGDVTNFYRKKMEDSGWKVTQNFERGNHAFLGFQRGNMIANVQIAEDPRYPGKRLIAIMYEEQKPLPFEEF